MLKNKKIILGIIISIFSFLFINTNAMAIDSASINAKAAFEGVRTCFNSGAFNGSWKASALNSNFVSGVSSDAVKLPYNLGHSVSNNRLDCIGVMLGVNGSNNGLNGGLIPNNIKTTSDVGTVAKYFAGNNLDGNGGLGYKAASNGGNIEGTGQRLAYNVTSSASECAGNAPVLLVSGSATTSITFPTIAKSGNSVTVSQGQSYNVPTPGSGTSYTFESSCAGANIKITDVGSSSSPKYQISVTDFYNNEGLNEYVSKFVIGTKVTNSGAEYTKTNIITAQSVTGKISLTASTEPVVVTGNTNNFSNDYTLTWNGGAYTQLLAGLNNNNRMGYNVPQAYAGYNYLALSRQEVYDLYKYYANDVLHLSITCKGDSNYALYEGSGIPINWKGGDSACRVYNTGNVSVPENMYGVDENRHFTAKIDSVQDIATALNNLGDLCSPKLNGVEGCDGTNESVITPTGATVSGATDGMNCDDIQITDGKIGAMQWILCPTMDNTRHTASWIDENIQSWLTTDASIYSNSAVTQVWGAIRNIANVVMVVFLLVIILSQLTGRGIDNYGIKKMLPRLIVMAIIVNLSLYICQIAADLSNIVGVGLRNMFESIGGAVNSDTSGSSFIGGMTVGLFASAGSVSTGVGAGLAAISLGAPIAVALIIVAIVIFLVIAAALMVFALMLGARQIIIIVCIVLAPLAFAAFILPNTQNLFKKWWDLFKAALIIFPICGAMGGISYLLRAMAQSGQINLGVGGYIIMMVLPYLVFFLLPTLLKNALSALGKFGGALTALGNTVRSGGRQLGQTGMRAAQGTETYKTMQAEAARRRQEQSAQRTIQRLNDLKDRNGSLNDAQTRQLARAHEVQRKLGNEDSAARTILADKQYASVALESDNPNDDSLIRRWESAWQRGDADEMDALTNVIVSRHGPGGVNAIASRLARAENDVFNNDGGFRNENMERSFNALRANMQSNSALANAMQSKASDVFQMVSSGGYVEHDRRDANGNVIMGNILDANGQVIGQRAVRATTRANVREHSANNSIATQDKDWATQSSATLRRAVESGALTSQTAQRILNSTDPTIQSGIKSDASKRRVLEAAAGGYSGNFSNAADVEAATARYRAQSSGLVNASYADRSASDVYDEAMAENMARDDVERQAHEESVRQAQAEYEQQEAAREEQERRDYEQTWQNLLDSRDREETMENNRRIRDAMETMARNSTPNIPIVRNPQTPRNTQGLQNLQGSQGSNSQSQNSQNHGGEEFDDGSGI